MKTYTVTVPIAGHLVVEVEAENAEDAIEKAMDSDQLTIDKLGLLLPAPLGGQRRTRFWRGTRRRKRGRCLVSKKGPEANMVPQKFRDELRDLINKHGIEQCGDTPDYMLAEYLCDCIEAQHKLVKNRDRWYKVEHRLPESYVDAGIRRAEAQSTSTV